MEIIKLKIKVKQIYIFTVLNVIMMNKNDAVNVENGNVSDVFPPTNL